MARKKAKQEEYDFDLQALPVMRQQLLDWFGQQKRDLPWRETSDPYAIWLSEMMLQQTRVETVKPYYHRFLERFPTVQDLASAPLDDVLGMWAGLGYYRRARHLHAAAQKVVEEYGGAVPSTLSEILKLPGVGRYTAGAILSIAYGKEHAVVDGNVHRILSRLFLIDDPVGSTGLDRKCWHIAEAWVQGENPGDLNQGMMELGSLVCTPRSPTCLLCPLRMFCKAQEVGQETALPTPKKATKVKPLDVLWAYVRRRGKTLLVQRPDTGLFAGMWELPGLYLETGVQPDVSLLQSHLEALGLACRLKTSEYETFSHILSHRRMQIRLYTCSQVRGRLVGPRKRWQWVDEDALGDLALSSITRKVLESQCSSS